MSGRVLLTAFGLRRLTATTEVCLAYSSGQYTIGGLVAPACTAYTFRSSDTAASPDTKAITTAGRHANCLYHSSQRQAPQARCFSAAAQPEGTSAEQLNPLLQTPVPAADDAAGRQAAPGQTAQAVQKGLQISPKKLNDFVSVVRRLPVGEAMLQCRVSPTKAARLTFKVIQSAQANAINNHHMDATRLFVDLAYVGKGTHLRRNRIHGRGRSGIMHRYYSHLTIVLREGDKKARLHVQRPMLERPRKHWPQSWPAAAAAAL